MTRLPIHAVINEIQETLATRDELVLEAPPGAGKTTIVPLALLAEPWLENQMIVMLQPRRIAARAAAERMAQLLDEPVGQRVGYQIRQESKTSRNTRIIVMTEGVLTRRLQSDPGLEGVGLVVFDEFHERSLDSDFGLALCLQGRAIFREKSLKLLVMSATLQRLNLATYLNNAPVITSEGKAHPVEVHYSERNILTGDITALCVDTTLSAIKHHDGNILVFLPGQKEIRQIGDALATKLNDNVCVLPLHGSLPVEEQRRAILRAPNQRKIVLATDIAETSLTIEGVKVVIDSGKARFPAYDPNTGLSRLTTRHISKASATQRAGRAGRLGPGVCFRLWSEGQHRGLAEQTPPEISQADLTSIVLQLVHWGAQSIEEIDWLTTPPQGSVGQSIELLVTCDAIERSASRTLTITAHGREMANMPTHPRLAHMLVYAAKNGLAGEACTVAALLSERDPFRNHGADFGYRISIVSGETTCPTGQSGWLKRVKKQEQQFRTLCKSISVDNRGLSDHTEDRYAIVLSHAYPDRLARRNARGHRYKLSNGRSAVLPEGDSLLTQEWMVIIEAGGHAGNHDDRIFLGLPMNPRLLDDALQDLVSMVEVAHWDESAERFIAERQQRVGEVLLSSTPVSHISQTQVAEAICDYIRSKGIDLLPWSQEDRQWQARVMLLHKELGSEWPDVSDAHLTKTLMSWLGPFLTSVRTLKELQKIPLAQALQSLITWEQSQQLRNLVPPAIKVPSGNHLKIDYQQTPPVLAVKLQEMFGCENTPNILQGRITLMVHLLSPARRPLQITQDLAGFWRNSYHAVKKEMKGRYPKHPWPDNPLEALPTAATKKRMGHSTNKP